MSVPIRLDDITWNAEGLVPVIVQDQHDGRVLMLAWANREALQATGETKMATFWSRSRQQLWVKGETSGNYLQVVELGLDCDQDTVLLQVNAAGPTCHRQTRSCFDPAVVREPEGEYGNGGS